MISMGWGLARGVLFWIGVGDSADGISPRQQKDPVMIRTLIVSVALATVAFAQPALAAARKGCSANCGLGTCSTTNQGAQCGCCADGTPYCGAASDCGKHDAVLRQVASIPGGSPDQGRFLEAARATLESKAGRQFVATYAALVKRGGASVSEIEIALEEAYLALQVREAELVLQIIEELSLTAE